MSTIAIHSPIVAHYKKIITFFYWKAIKGELPSVEIDIVYMGK